MSRRPAPAPDPDGGGRPPSRPTLHLAADLRLAVTAPDGRSAQVRVTDDGGTVRVALDRVGDLGVVGASLPGGLGGAAAQLVRLVRRGALPAPAWDQAVEVVVGSAVVFRRRGGRWSSRARSRVPVVAGVAGALLVAGLVVAAARRLGRG